MYVVGLRCACQLVFPAEESGLSDAVLPIKGSFPSTSHFVLGSRQSVCAAGAHKIAAHLGLFARRNGVCSVPIEASAASPAMAQTCGGGKDEDADASLSFLEPLTPASKHSSTVSHGLQKPPALQIAQDVVDSAFLNYTVRVPAKIEEFFKRIPKIKFIYDIDDADCMAIEAAVPGARPYLIHVDFFERFQFPADIESELIFILGRQKYRAAQKAAQKKAYMASVDSGIAYEGTDLYRSMRRRYLEYQVDTGRNFVFIEDTETLHRQIKNVVTVLGRKEQYVPKVKRFGEERKGAFLMSVLRNIPGVSENVARCIYGRYPTFGALRDDLVNNREALVNLTVCDSTGQNARPLGEKIFERLSVSFLSSEKNRRI